MKPTMLDMVRRWQDHIGAQLRESEAAMSFALFLQAQGYRIVKLERVHDDAIAPAFIIREQL